MKPEPLINKIYHKNKEIIWIKLEDIKAACEFFLNEIDDLYHKIGKTEVWRMNNDEVVNACEDYVKEKFKLAFKDVLEGDGNVFENAYLIEDGVKKEWREKQKRWKKFFFKSIKLLKSDEQ